MADVDGDGRTDLYFVNQAGPNGLWRNVGGGQFADITKRGGVALADRIGVSASFADLDNDGSPDLYVTNVRVGNVLFRNQGDGRFANISQESGLDHEGHSSAALFFDYDRDGQLDLFLTNVGQYTERGDPIAVIGFAPEVQAEQYHYYVGFKDAFAGHLKPERTEPNLLFRADWIRSNSRIMEFGDRTIQWRRLKRILRSYKCELQQATVGNRLNIIRKKRKGIFRTYKNHYASNSSIL